MRKLIISLFVAGSFLMLNYNLSFTQEGEVIYTERKERPRKEARELAIEREVRKLKTRFVSGLFHGFENNVYLDSSRKGDYFTEEIVGVDIEYPVNDRFKLKLSDDFSNINYYEFTDLSTLDNILRPGFEVKLLEGLKLNTWYGFEVLWYPRNEQGTYLAHHLGTNIRHDITDKIYQSVGYEYLHKGFTERKSRDTFGVRVGDERKDDRHQLKHELGLRIANSLFRLKNVYYVNDSNDRYQDFYDYELYRLSGSFTQPLMKKLSLMGSIGHEWRRYKSRLLSTNGDTEDDRVILLNAAVFYELIRSTFLVTSYGYRQNYSNDPIQEYSESIISAGVYYMF